MYFKLSDHTFDLAHPELSSTLYYHVARHGTRDKSDTHASCHHYYITLLHYCLIIIHLCTIHVSLYSKILIFLQRASSNFNKKMRYLNIFSFSFKSHL